MLALGYILLTCYAYMYPYYKKKKGYFMQKPSELYVLEHFSC